MKQFHSFRLDPLNQCLWRGDQRVAITPKVFDVLRYLVEHPGRLVTQEEILGALWPKAYVGPEVIKKYILGIRKVLGDHHDRPVFIETVPRRGYQFVAPVIEAGAPAPSALRLDTKNAMVGRAEALAELDSALDRALRGQRQVLFVTGEAGIGKTTVVDVFHQRAACRPNMRIARGQCVEGFGGKEAYYPMLEALGQLTRAPDRDPIVATLAARAPTWLIQFPSLVKAGQREALQREILGATRERMVREICEALEALTAEHPLVLIFEDLHWVDLSSLDLISAVARRREPAKLVLLCTYRPADVALSLSPLKGLKQDLQVHRLCEEIALEPLEEAQVAQYLALELADDGLPADIARLICRHSGGNALFMVEMVRDMVKRGVIAQGNEGWKLTTSSEAIDPVVPETLQRMLEVQFDRLSLPEQRILRSASVAGERFSVGVIAATLDLAPDRIEELCEGLAEGQQFIKSTGIEELSDGSVSARYEFRHSLYRQGIYRRISQVSRARLHRTLGQRLKSLCTPSRNEQALAAELALHFERGGEYERAMRYLVLVAETAAGRFAYRDAIQVLQQALGLAPNVAGGGGELEVQILGLIGDAYYALGAMADCARTYAAGAARAAQLGLKVARVDALVSLMRPFGLIDPDQGIAAIDEAASVSQSLGDPVLMARTEMLGAATRLLYDHWRTEDAELCASAERTLRRLGGSSMPPYHRMMFAYVEVLQGRCREALETFESYIANQDEAVGMMAYHFALAGRTVALLRLGQFGEALRIVQGQREMAEKNGNDPWLFNFREAWLRILALDFEGAHRVCESILRGAGSYPTAQPEAIARVAAGYAELDRNHCDQAIEYFRQVCDPRITPRFFLHWHWRMTARLGLSQAYLSSGDLARSRSEAGSALASALSTADPYLQSLAWEMKSRIAIEERNWDSAQEYVAHALAVLEHFEIPIAAWRVRATAWVLYQSLADDRVADEHRAHAEASILAIASTLPPGEPLRQSFLSAPLVRRILSNGKTSNVSLALG